MIKVKIQRDESTQKIVVIEVKGHAEQAEFGKDLVCAAISAIITGGMNALTSDSVTLKLEEGYALIKYDNLPDEHDAVVLNTIYTQLLTVQEDREEFIKISIL